MSDAVDHALTHARSLLDPSTATTVQFATEQADPQEATLASGGATDVEVAKPAHASKITAAVEVLILAVERLRDEVRRPDPRIDAVVSDLRDLRGRHERLTGTVQAHGSRLADIEDALVDLPTRGQVRLGLALIGFFGAISMLTLGAVVGLLVRL